MMESKLRKPVLAAVFVAMGTFLSLWSIPIGAARVFPAQAMINVLLAALVGVRYSVSAAFLTATLRNLLGIGSLFAYPGSMVGALLSAAIYQKTHRVWATAVAEIIGTGLIGAALSYPVAAYLLGKAMGLVTLISSFTASSLVGAVLGGMLTTVIMKRRR